MTCRCKKLSPTEALVRLAQLALPKEDLPFDWSQNKTEVLCPACKQKLRPCYS